MYVAASNGGGGVPVKAAGLATHTFQSKIGTATLKEATHQEKCDKILINLLHSCEKVHLPHHALRE